MKTYFGICLFLFSLLADGVAIVAVSQAINGIKQPYFNSISLKSDVIFLAESLSCLFC